MTVTNTASSSAPTSSSTIAYDRVRQVAWSVNPDNDSVARIDSADAVKEISLGNRCNPRNVAADLSGRAWVSCHRGDEIVVLTPTGEVSNRIKLRYGAAPYGVVASPDGSSIFVTLFGTGELVRYSTATLGEAARVTLGPTPRAIAITGSGSRAFVTRFISQMMVVKFGMWRSAIRHSLKLELSR